MLPPREGRRIPTRGSLGTTSLSIYNLLVFSSGANVESPVTLPPGRARLATRPSPTGSTLLVTTIGIVVVAFLAADAAGPDVTTIRSTLSRTKSAASKGRRIKLLLGKPVLDGEIFFHNRGRATAARSRGILRLYLTSNQAPRAKSRRLQRFFCTVGLLCKINPVTMREQRWG